MRPFLPLPFLLLIACGSPVSAPPRSSDALALLGGVALPITTSMDLTEALPIRAGDMQITRQGAASVQRGGGFDYLRAQYEVRNVGSAPVENLTLMAVAQQGNVGGTAIMAITGFGGVPRDDQVALASLVAPIPSVAVTASGALTLVAEAADFSALPDGEVTALASQPSWTTGYGPLATPLNYGFTVSRCTVDACTRTLNPGESGTVNVALRVPNGAAVGAAYDFLMNFALVTEPLTRVTRSVLPPESVGAAAARLDALNAPDGAVMQVEPTVQALPAGRTGQTIPTVRLTRDGAALLTAFTTVQSTPLGNVELTLNPDDRTITQDQSGTLEFAPGIFTDVDDVQGGVRYVTRTFDVRNLSGRSLMNVTLRAVTRPENLGGTAVVDVRGAPTSADPLGHRIIDPAFAQAFRPGHRTVLGASRPEIDPGGASFQAYRTSESEALSRRAGLGVDVAVLDYGFTGEGAARRTLAPGDVTRIHVAYRLPRTFGTQPKPYAVRLSFLAITDDSVRVSQATGETRVQVLSRAQALLGPVQVVQVNATDRGDLPTTDVTGLLPMATPTVRVGTGTTQGNGGDHELRSER